MPLLLFSLFALYNSAINKGFLAIHIGTEYAQDKEDSVTFIIVFMNGILKSHGEIKRWG